MEEFSACSEFFFWGGGVASRVPLGWSEQLWKNGKFW